MTHALAPDPLLLSVVLLALVAEALSVLLRRPAPRLLRRRHRAGRRAVHVPSVAGATEEELSVASGADAPSQLLHEPPSPPSNWTRDRRAWHPRCRVRRFRRRTHAARSWNSAPHLFAAVYATTSTSPDRARNRPTDPASSRAPDAREPALLDAPFHPRVRRRCRTSCASKRSPPRHVERPPTCQPG